MGLCRQNLQDSHGLNTMRILGIDPGIGIVGYGVVDTQGNHYEAVTYGTIRTQTGQALPIRLKTIFEDMGGLLSEMKPDVAVIEQLFFFKNAKTIIPVTQARGVIMLACELQQVLIAEYTPLQIKQTITGFGRAEKREVQEMVTSMLSLESIPRPNDAADALAIAICHAHHLGYS